MLSDNLVRRISGGYSLKPIITALKSHKAVYAHFTSKQILSYTAFWLYRVEFSLTPAAPSPVAYHWVRLDHLSIFNTAGVDKIAMFAPYGGLWMRGGISVKSVRHN